MLAIQVSIQTPHWNYLMQCGVPLYAEEDETLKREKSFHFSEEQFCLELRKACVFVSQDSSLRQEEALQAMLLALQIHYPAFFKKRLSKSKALMDLVQRPVTGKVIKLRRIALARVSGYL